MTADDMLDEARAAHRRGLARAMRAEVLDVLVETMRARMPIRPSDAILADAADAIVARLAGLWDDLDPGAS